MIAATILAAGASTRMGLPKALLIHRERTFLQSILDSTSSLGLMTVVALGHDSDKLLAAHDLSGVTTVTNQHLHHGPIGSIRASIRALENYSVEGLLVWPVDLPHVAVATVRRLIDRFLMGDCPAIVVPQFTGRGGHPVVFSKLVFSELMSVDESEGAGAVVRRDRSRVAQVLVDDRAVIDCINTPDAYREMVRRG